ncbi:MAG: hypothetical protein VKP70_12100 [Cyanobacteriota bacterium]|nr:hypothetical protein [Cyanobacteriota bacterium]
MTLVEAMLASLLFLLGTSAAAQLWNQGLRASQEVAQREKRLHRLETLLLASEGAVRDWAARQGPASDCQGALEELLPRLRALNPAGSATFSHPPSPPGTLHLRWEEDGLRKERLLSPTALELCREGADGP